MHELKRSPPPWDLLHYFGTITSATLHFKRGTTTFCEEPDCVNWTCRLLENFRGSQSLHAGDKKELGVCMHRAPFPLCLEIYCVCA